MPDSRADQILKLKQSITSLEAQQIALGLDLSGSIEPLRAVLASLEQTIPASATQSGGVNAAAEQLTIGGDVVGRDKIESTAQTINASGSVTLNHSPVYGDIHIGPPITLALDESTALNRYLTHVIESNRRLQLQGIRSSSGLVSIELEEIYITLTATERRTVKDEQQWIDEMSQTRAGRSATPAARDRCAA